MRSTGAWARAFVGFCWASAAFGFATSASAFCRTSSCELGEGMIMSCERDSHGCVTEGKPVHWSSSCLSYAVQLDGSLKSGLAADQVQALVTQAFAAWQNATCAEGGSPSFQAQFQGFVSCDQQEAVCGGAGKNVNVVMFHDSGWPYGSTRLGVTTATGGVDSGLVIDADVELNSQDFTLSTDVSSPSMTALLYVVSHELGHFLGLAHSDVEGALMSEGYQSRVDSADLLSEDDIAAICAAYPPNAKLSCTEPKAPAYDACATAPGDAPKCTLASKSHDGGCSLSTSVPRPCTASGALLAALLAGLLGRRRKPLRLRSRADRG